jgi:hypothetical protein
LSGLVTRDVASRISLDVLTDADATALLIRFLGQERVTAKPEAVAQIVEYCARLPLALGIAAAHAAGNNAMSLAQLADELAESAADPASAATALISWAYRKLRPPARRLLRVLGTKAESEFGAGVASGLAALPLPETRTLLTELARARLIEEHLPGMYRLRDVVRAFAMTLAVDDAATTQSSA